MLGRGGEVQGSVRLQLQPRLDALVRCALCHDALAPPESVCSRCFTRLHEECRAALTRCPTLGCVPVVTVPTSAPPTPGPERRVFGLFELGLVFLIIATLGGIVKTNLGHG